MVTIEKMREYNRKSYYKHRDKRLTGTKEYHRRIKFEVLGHYSNDGWPFCRCCGERIIEFLGIDHIGGGGSEHRKAVGQSIRLYLWLKRNNYPMGYQVLCHNCNLATSWGRKCPHELLEK